jgi:hypothetical protein
LTECLQQTLLLKGMKKIIFCHFVCTETGMLNGNTPMSVSPAYLRKNPRGTHVRRGEKILSIMKKFMY